MLIALATAASAAPFARAALPSSWGPQPIDVSPPTANAGLGASLVNPGDLDGDGQDDLVIGAPDLPISADGTITGRVYALRSSGALIWDAEAPASQPANVPGSDSTRFGGRLARLGDVGRCILTGENCNVGTPDGAPEILVSAPGTDTGGGEEGRDEGAVYVLDGASGRLLKQIHLAATERPVVGSAGFGKAVSSLSGQPPCAGFGGLGACAYAATSATALGDLNGGGEPDLVVGAPDFTETDADLATCTQGLCAGVGRVYVFHGEAIEGSSATPLEIPGSIMRYPGALAASETPRFGGALAPLGDLGRCEPVLPATDCVSPNPAPSNQPDGRPDLLISSPGAHVAGVAGAGSAFVMDATANAAMKRVDNPQPQQDSAFGGFAEGSPPAGNLGSSTAPDLLIGAPLLGPGAAFAFDGDVASGGLIAAFEDPAAVPGGAFGAAAAGLGDIAADAPGEVAFGAASGARTGAVHVASPCADFILRTISDPDLQSESRFGASIAPLGDRNGDGFLDLVVGAPGYDGSAVNQGRVYVLISAGPALAFAGCGGPGSGGGDGGGGDEPVTEEDFFDPAPGGPAGSARALRRLRLVASPRRMSRGGALRLRGSLRANVNRSKCQSRQKIALQRRKLSGGRWQLFEVAVTAKNGDFKASTRPSRSYFYRARVSQTSRCMGATSKAARVVVRRAAGARR